MAVVVLVDFADKTLRADETLEGLVLLSILSV